MRWLVICGTARVAYFTAYFVLVLTNVQAAQVLLLPFVASVLVLAVYDDISLLRSYRRARARR